MYTFSLFPGLTYLWIRANKKKIIMSFVSSFLVFKKWQNLRKTSKQFRLTKKASSLSRKNLKFWIGVHSLTVATTYFFLTVGKSLYLL